MPLLVGYDLGGLEPRTRQALDHILASIQTWAAQVDGVNAAERLNELASGISGLSTVQPGTIHAFGGATAPTGYLVCDGSAVSRTTYANLFAAISTAYGVGNGTTTFNLPDGRGRYFFGKATSGTGSTLGGTFGTIDHTHTGGTVSGSTANESAHTHGDGSYAVPAHDHGGNTGNNDQDINLIFEVGIGDGDVDVAADPHAHPISEQAAMNVTGTSGAGSAHLHAAGTLAVGTSGTANPPSFVGNWIIKT